MVNSHRNIYAGERNKVYIPNNAINVTNSTYQTEDKVCKINVRITYANFPIKGQKQGNKTKQRKERTLEKDRKTQVFNLVAEIHSSTEAGQTGDLIIDSPRVSQKKRKKKLRRRKISIKS